MQHSRPLPTLVTGFRDPEDGRVKRMLLVAPNGIPKDRPILPFEIIGVFDPDSPPPYSGPNGFRQNGMFLSFLHWVIANEVPNIPAAWEEALALGNGRLQILDGRAQMHSPSAPAEEEDILGYFEVRDGEIVQGSYQATFTHRPLTDKGLFQLETALCDKVLQRLIAQVSIELAKPEAGDA